MINNSQNHPLLNNTLDSICLIFFVAQLFGQKYAYLSYFLIVDIN
jgi:hypothetical protein